MRAYARVSLFLPVLLLTCLGSHQARAADLILLSDHVLTMRSAKPAAEALAVVVEGESIRWVGPQADALRLAEPETRIVQLGAQALLPGFIDAHGHISFVGINTQLANVASPPVGPARNIPDLQNTLKEYIKRREIPPGEWVVGNGYDDSLLAEQRHPDADDLNAVSTEHPILLIHVSGHLATTNSRALARVGINSETKDPPGGHIRRRPGSQSPNGVLEENAMMQLRQYMMAPIKDPVAAFSEGLSQYARNGITTAQDGAANAQVINLMLAADQAGQVPIDVVAYPFGQLEEMRIAQQWTYGEYTGRIKVGGVKLMLDGSPQGKTAYLRKPYYRPPHGQGQDYRGYPNIAQLRTTQLVKFYLDRRIPVIAHANGDAAADMLIEAVAQAAPENDHRTVMIHAQTVRDDQLDRMVQLGMIPSFFSAHTFFWGDWHRDSVFGIERASRISPTASAERRGLPFTIHNDAPIVPPDMLRLLWATTNRQTRSGKILGAAQQVSVYSALRAITVHAAHQNFEEQIKGQLIPGMQADLVVLSKNPLDTPIEDLKDLQIIKTFSRGREVFAL